MRVEDILKNIMEENNMSKAQLGRAVGVVTAEEAKEKPSKATDVINKRMKQKNISVNVLSEMLAAMGYKVVVMAASEKTPSGAYVVDAAKIGNAGVPGKGENNG